MGESGRDSRDSSFDGGGVGGTESSRGTSSNAVEKDMERRLRKESERSEGRGEPSSSIDWRERRRSRPRRTAAPSRLPLEEEMVLPGVVGSS
jgi:hypothetical protein